MKWRLLLGNQCGANNWNLNSFVQLKFHAETVPFAKKLSEIFLYTRSDHYLHCFPECMENDVDMNGIIIYTREYNYNGD